MAAGRPKQTEAERDRDLMLTWHWGKILKNVMNDAAIDNKDLAKLANVDPAAISRLRNGSLSQRNYIHVIRSLPHDARKEYLDRVFFGEIPNKLPADIKEKYLKKTLKDLTSDESEIN